MLKYLRLQTLNIKNVKPEYTTILYDASGMFNNFDEGIMDLN